MVTDEIAVGMWSAKARNHSVSTCRPLRLREVRRLQAPSSFAVDAGLRQSVSDSALPTFPTIRFPWGGLFRSLVTVHLRYDLSSCLPPWRIRPSISARPTGAFTSGLSMNWSPVSSPDIATVATGQVPRAGLAPARMGASIAALRFAPTSRPASGNTRYWPVCSTLARRDSPAGFH
jgi:hypothetical protein